MGDKIEIQQGKREYAVLLVPCSVKMKQELANSIAKDST